MNEEQFGLTNSGNDVVKIPVEKRERTELEKEVDAELIDHAERGINDFDETQAIIVHPKKKRGRPKKALSVIREFYCATCRETYLEQTLMKMPAGEGRYALFCNVCQKSLGFFQPDVDAKIAKLHKNPSKK